MHEEIEAVCQPAEVETPAASGRALAMSSLRNIGDRIVLGAIALFALFTAIVPFAVVFFRFEADYSEGWNAYNTFTLARHLPLYAEQYGWTTVNYPALYYFLTAHLSRLTQDFLLLGRVLSLVSFALCVVLVGAIVRKVTGRVAPALFGASFCLAIFCTQAPLRVANSEPNMPAYALILAAFWLYLFKRDSLSLPWTSFIVLLFVVGGNIKHNPIDFPLAVFLDLCLLTRRRAAQFFGISAALIGLSIFLHMEYAGPFFVSNMFGPRAFDFDKIDFRLPVIGPITIAFLGAMLYCRHGLRRPLALLLLASIVLNLGFGAGRGSSVNVFFSSWFSISIVLGVLLDSAWQAPPRRFSAFPHLWRWGVPILLVCPLVFTFFYQGRFLIPRELKQMRTKQANFAAEVAFLKSRPGPAICESLLRCYEAGKPYIYDPFNATQFIEFRKLDASPMIAALNAKQFSAVQLNRKVEQMKRPNERFTGETLEAIQRNYVLAADDPGCAIYVPTQ